MHLLAGCFGGMPWAAICSAGAGSSLLPEVHQMCHGHRTGAGLNKPTFSKHTEDLTKNYLFFFFCSSEQCKVHRGHRGQFICQMEILESKKTL